MQNKLFLLLIISTSLLSDSRQFNEIVHKNKIDIKSKSLKSWMRIFNSSERIKSSGFTVTETERYIMLKGLKSKQKKSKNRYARRLR
ncbi:MAG: hypothetical protein U9P38_04535 [Campylobacterota bacterium]|nr:hypothetical protein [Campylobacterota bacterium]